MAAPDNPRVSVLANELLGEFQRGYSLEKLRPLLLSPDRALASTAIWITSELGEMCRPLLGDALKLLGDPAKKTRFWAVDCLLWAPPSERHELASGVALIDDQEPSIRWKVMDFLSRASKEQLHAALSVIEDTGRGSSLAHGLSWLLSPAAEDDKAVISLLKSGDPLLRKFGVVAATRMHSASAEALSYASSTNDAEIKQFADGWLARI
jgi:hypothetical protein